MSNAHCTVQFILHITYFTHTIHDPPPPPPSCFGFSGPLELMQSLQIERCERRIHCIYFTRINFTHTNNVIDVEWEIKRWKFETKLNKRKKIHTKCSRVYDVRVCVCAVWHWRILLLGNTFLVFVGGNVLRSLMCQATEAVNNNILAVEEKQQQTICQ